MKWFQYAITMIVIAVPLIAVDEVKTASQTKSKQLNILVIMGDDVGWFNISAYHRGIMSGKTPHLDKLANEGIMFTDYTQRQAVLQEEPILLPGNCPYVLV